MWRQASSPPTISTTRPRNLDVALTVRGVDDADGDAGVAVQVARLLAPFRRVDQHVRAVMVDPDRRHLGRTVFHQRDELGEMRLVEEALYVFGELH